MRHKSVIIILLFLFVNLLFSASKSILNLPLENRGPGDYEYLIVTSNTLKDSFHSFIEFNKRRCLRTKVASIHTIISNTNGNNDQDKLRNYIKEQYESHNIVYVLLAGDINTIPFRELFTECYDHHQTPDRFLRKYSVADMYYSCLEGNWNNDGDNKYGEPGEEDMTHEVFVSRLPVDNSTELNYCVNKIIKYSEQPVTNQTTNALLTGTFLWDDYGVKVWGADHNEQYVGICRDSGYVTKGFPISGWSISRLNDKQNGSHMAWRDVDFKNRVLTAKPTWINFVGHGNTTYAFNQNTSFVNNSNYTNNGTNANFFLMYAVSCNSGQFKVNDCILEQFLTIQNGAVACVGLCENFMLDDDGLDGATQRIARYFHDAVFNKGIHYLEMMNAYSKEMNADLIIDPNALNKSPYFAAVRFAAFQTNVLGDPALSIWTAKPEQLTPVYDTILSTLTFSIQTVPYSWVAIVDADNTIITTKMSDENGNCLIDDPVLADFVSTNPQKTIKIRIKAHNFLPFEGKLIINRVDFISMHSPAGGEQWGRGKLYPITWYDDIDDNVTIELYKGEQLHSVIVNPLVSTSPYAWTINDSITPGADYKIGITSLDRPHISDKSLSAFSIIAPSITVHSPNGGEVLYVGSKDTITWKSAGLPDNMDIKYSTNGGTNWTSLATNTENDGIHVWTIPNVPSTTCRIQILSTLDGTPVDMSDHNFTIAAPIIELASPNGGEAWYIGEDYTITWSTKGFVGDVSIAYSIDKGANWLDIVAGTPNDGAHPWTIPNNPSSLCMVRISETSDSDPVDESNGTFIIEIEPKLSLSYPVGGEVLYIDTTYTIRWSSIGRVGNVKLEYSPDTGAHWSVIAASTENDGLFDWKVPDLTEGRYIIRVSDALDGVPKVVSNTIYIEYAPSITVSYPNGGETFYVGMVYKITWLNKGTVGDIKIEYSSDSGATWNIVVSRVTNNGSYNWKIPDEISDICLIKISEATNDDIVDISNNNFSIASPFIKVSAPNGGEKWQAGKNHQINWSGEGFLGDVKIEYTIDNGSTWKIISENTPNSGTYSWNIPKESSLNCKVRVSESANANPVDESDTTFEIEDGTAIQNKTPHILVERFDIIPNPLDLDRTNKMSFFITSKKALKKAWITVYDPLGNELISIDKNIQSKKDKRICLGTWNLSTKAGKRVSKGTYLVLLKIVDAKGNVSAVKRLVGVKE